MSIIDTEKQFSEAPPPSGWQPIETAPRDGTPILAIEQGVDEYGNATQPDYMAVNWNVHHKGWVGFGLHFESFSPDHWMPLPEPPK